ncbi:MAG: DMT family transporter [Patescibacteria group bacterium]
MSARYRAYIYILIAIILWGIAGPVIKYTLGYFDTITFLTIRFGLTSLILVPFWIWTERHKKHLFPDLTYKDWTVLIVYGVTATTIELGLLFLGFAHTSAIEATLIFSTAPILIALAGFYFLKEHITKKERVGMFVAFAGTIIVVFGPISGNIVGNLFVMLANLAKIVEVVLMKKLLRHNLSPLFLTMFSFFVGFLSITPIYFLSNHQLITNNVSLSGYLGLAYMVLFSGIIAYWLFLKGQKTIEVSEANMFTYLQPLITTPLAFFWLGESLTWNFLIGGAVVALGVGLAMRRS